MIEALARTFLARMQLLCPGGCLLLLPGLHDIFTDPLPPPCGSSPCKLGWLLPSSGEPVLHALCLPLSCEPQSSLMSRHLDRSTACLLSQPSPPGRSFCLQALPKQCVLGYINITSPTPRRLDSLGDSAVTPSTCPQVF